MPVKGIPGLSGICLQRNKTWKESNNPDFEIKEHIKDFYKAYCKGQHG